MRRPSPSTAALPAALLLLALAAGCSRCGAGRAAGPPADRWVPAQAPAVVLVPKVAEAARQAAALHATLASLPGQYELQALRGAISAQLSVDPFEPASLTAAGLDVEGGAALAELPGAQPGEPGPALLVLPVADQAKLTDLLARLARDRLGAAQQGLENANGRPITVWRRAAGEPAMLAMAVAERSALVSAGPGGPAAVRAALALDPAVSLSQAPGWKRAREALGEGGAALVYAPASGGPLVPGLAAEALAAAISATARSLRVAVAAPLGAAEPRLRPLAPPGPGRAGPSALDPATVAAARLSARPAALLALADEALGPGWLAGPLRRGVALLEGPVDVGVALAPRADLGGALAGRALDDPLRVVRVEVVAGLQAGAAPGPILDEVARAGGGAARDGRWRVPAGAGEVAFAVAGQRLLVAAGPADAIDALVARATGQGAPAWKPPTPAAGEALAGGLGGLVLDGGALSRSLQALPPEAYGTGPDAVVARSLAQRAVLPGGQAVTASLRADLPAGALRLALELSLSGPEPAP